MKLRFLGTGTSMGVPVIGCSCSVCRSLDPHNQRLRTSALLEYDGASVLIDAGPDLRTQALRAHIYSIDAVLLTHAHFDHVAGIDDLRPLCSADTPIPIFSSPATLDDVYRRFSYAFDNSSAGSTRPKITLCPVNEAFTIKDKTFIPVHLWHGTLQIVGYRIGSLGYITDASLIPPESMDQLRGLDVLVLNALRYTPHPTHFSIEQALAVVADLKPRQAFFVHMNHDIDHGPANAQLPAGVSFAYDGLEVTIAD